MNRLLLSLWTLCLLGFLSSCSDPTLIGSDLLEDDKVGVGFSDTLSLIAETEMGDSVRTYSPVFDNQMTSYLFGDMQDPVFGRSKSSLYIQPLPEFTNPDFRNIEIDSVVLVLPYDTNAFYGNIAAIFGIDVLELDEEIPNSEEYFSDQTFMTKAVPLGTHMFQPKFDSLDVIERVNGEFDTTTYAPQLRIPLDLSVGMTLTRFDSAVYANDSTFGTFFKGLHLRPTITNEGMIAFNLKNSTLAGIHIYYMKDDTIPTQFQFGLVSTSTRFANYEHDYSGSVVSNYIDNTTAGEEFLFVQGMAGTNIRIEIPDYGRFKDGYIINRAELEVTVATLDEDPPGVFDPARGLILSRKSDEGILQAIRDIEIIVNGSGLSIPDLFGGLPEDSKDGSVTVYKMNLSSHFQEMLEGLHPNELYLTAFPKTERAGRSVLFGTEHPTYSIKLKLAFTEI